MSQGDRDLTDITEMRRYAGMCSGAAGGASRALLLPGGGSSPLPSCSPRPGRPQTQPRARRRLTERLKKGLLLLSLPWEISLWPDSAKNVLQKGRFWGGNGPCMCELGRRDWQSSARPTGTYWIFLVKFLETIPPSTCCSSCLPAGKANTPHQHLTRRLFFPLQKSATKPNRKVFRAAVSLPQCKPFLRGGLRKPLHVGKEMLDTAQLCISSGKLGSHRLPRAGA